MAPNSRIWKRQAEPVTEADETIQPTTSYPLEHFNKHLHRKHHTSTTTEFIGKFNIDKAYMEQDHLHFTINPSNV